MIFLAALALLQSVTAQPSRGKEPTPPTFEQATKLPVEILARQALGSSGVLFKEVQRPYLAGLPPVTSYDLTFATVPERTRYDGLCQASTVTIVYWTRDQKIAENISDHPVVAKFWRQETLFRYLPLSGRLKPGADDCERAGPVLRERNREWDKRNPGFGYGKAFGRELTEIDAYFAGRAVEKAISYCNRRRCVVPAQATAAFPIERLAGFKLDYCEKDGTKLCVTANFSQPSPKERPGPLYGLEVEILTDSNRVTPGDFAVTGVTHRWTEAHVH